MIRSFPGARHEMGPILGGSNLMQKMNGDFEGFPEKNGALFGLVL